MSSTNRGAERQPHDYYVTPQADIRLFLHHFENDARVRLAEECILDPCAGGSERDEMSYPAVLLNDFGVHPDLGVVTIDIREDSLARIKGDYLKWAPNVIGWKPTMIITNPPFNLSLEFIEKALNDVCEGGYVIMLQRLNFLGSKKRKAFFEKHMPVRTYVHHERIDFFPDWLKAEIREATGKKPSGDSIEYAHFVWRKGENPDHSILKVI